MPYSVLNAPDPACRICMKEVLPVRIAIPLEGESIFQHFGEADTFKLYDVENNTVLRSQTIGTGGMKGDEAIVGFLHLAKVGVVICGGISGNARAALLTSGIVCYPAVIGAADDAVRSFTAGRLSMNPQGCRSHVEGGGCAGCKGCGSK